jgi:carboxypeptidase C (cathepsin A)
VPGRFETYARFEPSAARGAAAGAPALPADEQVEISVYLRPRRRAGSYAQEADPRLAMRQHRERAHADDIVLLREFAAANGLTVLGVEPARRLVRLGGPASRVQSAFRTTLHQVEFEGRNCRVHAGVLHLPTELMGVVESVLGLDTAPIARPRLRPAAATARGHLPTLFASLYDFPSGDGSGQVVGLIELGGGYTDADTQAAFSAMGVSPPTVVAVPVDGAANQPTGSGADGEVALDIQIAGGVAPGATIVVYFTPNTEQGFADAVSAAAQDATHHPSILSISWGAPEANWTVQARQTLDSQLQDAAELGLSVFVASGDSLATDGLDDGQAHVDFPASSTWAIGCGGTRTTISGSALGAETVWNDGDSGTGGGISDVFAVPGFQAKASLPASVNGGRHGRGVPDVAANAAPETGWLVVVGGQSGVVGGTSAAAPLWAGLIARINQGGGKAGFFLPRLYGAADVLGQVTSGNNRPSGSSIGYDAGPGWNACTGLGTPRGKALAALLAGQADSPSNDPQETAMADPAVQPVRDTSRDQPLNDTTAYGNGPNDSVTDTTERAAITHHQIALGGKSIGYTATAGHLVAVDPSSSRPAATFFYVAFTADQPDKTSRPVTFFYNGGPGSSSVYVLLGSFAPMRIKTSLPGFTPPAPYTIETNPDSLLDRSDLVFVNPVGTGYSAAIAPKLNKDFWGVDQDAGSLCQFIKRYLTVNDRWNSPKFLFGESYGTARSCVLAYKLHEDGVDLNGVTLQSSILDYAQAGNPVGLLPTCATDAWYHDKVSPRPADLAGYAQQATQFAEGPYKQALAAFPKADPATVQRLSQMIGIDRTTLDSWSLNVAAATPNGTEAFLVTLLQDQGLALGSYDGRATGIDTGIAATIDPNSGGNDPTMTAVNGAYTAMWNSYLNDQLLYTSTSAFTDLNDQTFANWDFHHIDPTGAQKGIDDKGNVILYTAGDLAAVMSLNVDLKVLSANGYYDSVTPFFQTAMDLRDMPLKNAAVRGNLTIRDYPSGHMIYLDGGSRTALKADLAAMYDAAVSNHAAVARIRALQARV